MLRTFFFSIITLFGCLAISCADPVKPDPECTNAGFFSTPEKIINTLTSQDTLTPERCFLLGRAYRDSKDNKKAILYYANSCFTSHRDYTIRLFPAPVYRFIRGFHFKSDMYDDAVYQIGALFYQYREYDYAARFARLVSRAHPGLYREAKLLEAQALASSNKEVEARNLLKGLALEYPDSNIITIRLVSVLIKSGAYNDALTRTIELLKKDKPAWITEISLGQLAEITEKGRIALSPADSLVRARALYENKNFKEALELVTTLQSDGKISDIELYIRILSHLDRHADITSALTSIADTKERIRLTFAAAEEYRLCSNWTRALPLYQEIDKSTIEPFSKDALQRICHHMINKNKTGYGAVLKSWITRYPDDPDTGKHLWNLARLDIRKSLANAVPYLKESITKFPSGNESDACRFWLIKYHLSQNDRPAVDALLGDMIIHNPDSPYTWRMIDMLVHSLSKDKLENEFKLSITAGRETVAIISHTLLFALDHDRSACNMRIKEIYSLQYMKPFISLEKSLTKPEFSKPIQHYLNMLEPYFKAGCTEEITREIESLPEGKDWDEAKDTVTAAYAVKYTNPYISTGSMIRLFHSRKIDSNIALLGETSRKALYPLAFSAFVKTWSERYNLDPSLVYAIMKAESLFNPAVISSAGAVGLMQLMPATASGIAKEISLATYSLTDPETSIRLGSHYLAWLDRYYKSDVDKMVAAYNAGAGNVNRWSREMSGADRDIFSEFTPFEETRGYILRTGKFLIHYRMLGGIK